MRSLIFNAFFYSYTFYIAFRVFLRAKFSTQERMHPILRLWADTVLRAVEVILRSKVEIRGLENVPDPATSPVMMVSKHQSELDVVLLGKLFPNVSAVAMKELERYPFFGTILSKLELVMISVEQGPQNRTAEAIEGARRMFAQGRPMIIYPEGELMNLGAKERYRRGAAHIYAETGCVVVPVAASLGVVWPRRDWKKHIGVTGAIEYLEPIQPGMDFESFQAEIERRIEEATIRLIREHAPADILAVAEDRHARGATNKDG